MTISSCGDGIRNANTSTRESTVADITIENGLARDTRVSCGSSRNGSIALSRPLNHGAVIRLTVRLNRRRTIVAGHYAVAIRIRSRVRDWVCREGGVGSHGLRAALIVCFTATTCKA